MTERSNVAVAVATVETSRLPQLIALASEGSSEKRRLLLRELTDHFFGATDHGAAEIALYGEVLDRLCDEMEAAVRAELSARFADAVNAPRRLIRRLANDQAQVAAPVLRASPMLTDDDLIKVARSRSQDHLRAVSGRAEVSEAVSDAIVEHGDDDTLHALLRNDGARLSRAASETAVERAKLNPALHAATVQRKTLPLDLLNEMYFTVEARLRQQILEQNARINPDLLEAALSAGRTRVAAEDGALPADYAEQVAYVDELHAAGQLTPQVLVRFLRSNGRTPFLIALAKLSDLDFHTARSIVERKDLDALSVVCKASDMDRAIYMTYAVAILGSEDNPMGKAAAYGRMYSELTRDAALRTLRFWRMRRTAQAA
ncbi:DUF2336 domain-containing protein [Brevundimonas sp. SORGH_AS_0993]|uniref:DUF2336 domain-containing protein n=1 Tax=Brevundimonas sp. SORGH_AS_0993 TaxID=3041794 RepID=UPI0027887483|nr:DUF2336 domain-containing protein [Brevundimonas sp. SORGH_AS_0993]MDQ1155382.1 uncharacterized protein (DUF2336 family) [Brevundimonas sp. SORGH_AS_0993]